MVLETEVKHFESLKTELLRQSPGKFVLIIGPDLLGIFDRPEEAYRVGIQSRGNVPMLIKQVLPEDPAARLPAMTLGLLYAGL
ncbi:MAG: hypothetical protein HY712_05580 [candidate division NC10 bacterium]|nr:hypothetical protein [candidate division NC10 bacterium]